MRPLKWLGVQLWKRTLLWGIVAYAAVVAAIVSAETAIPRHAKAIAHVGEIVGVGVVYLAILILIIKFARRVSPKEMSTAAVAVAVIGWILYLLGFQVLVAVLASSGDLADSLSRFKSGITGGAEGQVIALVEAFCLLAIPGLLVVYPQRLRRRLSWDRTTELSRTLLPAWLAAAAAVTTWIYILLLHFAGGPLAHTSLLVLLVAGFGVATLLAPLYQFLSRSCWQYGSDAVFDPVRWRAAVVKVHREIKATDPLYQLAMLRQSAHTPNPRAGSDPQDNWTAGP